MRYFFNIVDDRYDRDEEGQELPDHDTARSVAVQYAGQLMRDRPEIVWKGQELRVEVTDKHGLLLFTLLILGVDAPAALATE